jgi:hypothetical protein
MRQAFLNWTMYFSLALHQLKELFDGMKSPDSFDSEHNRKGPDRKVYKVPRCGR